MGFLAHLHFLEQLLHAKQALVQLGSAEPLGLQLPLDWVLLCGA